MPDRLSVSPRKAFGLNRPSCPGPGGESEVLPECRLKYARHNGFTGSFIGLQLYLEYGDRMVEVYAGIKRID